MAYKNWNYTDQENCVPAIQERIEDLLFEGLDRHAKVLIVCFNVQFPADFDSPDDNSYFGSFIKEFSRYLRRFRYYGKKHYRKQSLDPLYIWSREQHCSHNQHYHVTICMDGTVITKMPTLRKANEIWNRLLGKEINSRGLIHYANAPGSLLHRSDHIGIERTLNALYYLAKDYSKFSTPGSRMWNSSRI